MVCSAHPTWLNIFEIASSVRSGLAMTILNRFLGCARNDDFGFLRGGPLLTCGAPWVTAGSSNLHTFHDIFLRPRRMLLRLLFRFRIGRGISVYSLF